MSNLADQWSAGSTYELFMGRWSRELAREFVSWLSAPPGLHWLDVGCGTGALTDAICSSAQPQTVTACDPARPFVEYARGHSRDARVSFVVADAETFPLRPDGYESIASLLALNFFPNPDAALARMREAARPDSVISACVWDYRGGMQFLRYFWDAAVALDSTASRYDEGVRFPICQPEELRALFRRAGLADIRCEAIDIVTEFAGFTDYWQPFLGGTGPGPSFVASLEAVERDRLCRKLESVLPVGPDGGLPLRARAWAVRGVTPRSGAA